ncbi:MAG: hypothetical protein ACI4O7_02550 [Aristaeellaceae bacterium]
MYTENLCERAGRIDLAAALPPDADLAQPSTGYIHYFGKDTEGNCFGWINPQAENPDDTMSSRYAMDEVRDPVLLQYLKENEAQNRGFWMRKRIRVRYWCVAGKYNRPSAWDVSLASDSTREELRRELWLPDAEAHQDMGCRIRLASTMRSGAVAYEDIPRAVPPVTREERQRLQLFHEEAIHVASNTPAVRNRIADMWDWVGQNSRQKLLDNLRSEDGLYGTRVAYILEAACSYLDRDYARVLQCCVNAQSFRLGMQVAQWQEDWSIVQRMAEELFDEIQEDVLQILCEAAVHTGNAELLCGVFAELLEAAEEDDSLADVCEIFAESIGYLLNEKGISQTALDQGTMVEAVRSAYAAPLGTLNELLASLRGGNEPDAAVPAQAEAPRAEAKAEAEAEAEAAEQPLSYEEVRNQFNAAFRMPDGSLRPVSDIDRDMAAILDRMLKADAPDIGDYRIPLLLRLAYDPAGSGKYVQRYISQLEDMAQRKRRNIAKDRRWRLFKAIEAFLETGQGLEKAMQEAQGNDEPRLLNSLAARR